MRDVNSRFVCGVLLAGGLMLSGCATEQYVDEQIAGVNGRIEPLNGRVAAVEGQVQQIGGRVDRVDQTSQEALKLAQGKLVVTSSCLKRASGRSRRRRRQRSPRLQIN
jgi:outer membrane murein-binding lipoprotein Lpp